MATATKNKTDTNKTLSETILFIVVFTTINSVFAAYTSILYMFFRAISGHAKNLDHINPEEYVPLDVMITVVFLATAISLCRTNMSPWKKIGAIMLAGCIEGMIIATTECVIANHF